MLIYLNTPTFVSGKQAAFVSFTRTPQPLLKLHKRLVLFLLHSLEATNFIDLGLKYFEWVSVSYLHRLDCRIYHQRNDTT